MLASLKKGLSITSASFASLLLLGTGLTLFLTILTGGTETSILKKFYWLETDCSNFPGSPVSSTCRWTNYGLCGVSGNENSNCTHAAAAYPFSPADNFHSNDNLPSKFIDNSNYFYHTSKAGYAFSLIGLAFLVFSWFPYFASLFTKNTLSSLKSLFWSFYAIAAVFIITGISLTTASFVKGRNHFKDAGYHTKLGTNAMATAWTTFFLMIFNIGFLVGALINHSADEGVEVGVNTGNTETGIYTPAADNTPWYNKWHKKEKHEVQLVTPVVAQGETIENNGINNLTFTPVKEKALSTDMEAEKETPTTLYN